MFWSLKILVQINELIKFVHWKFGLRASRDGGPAWLVALLLGARPVSAQTPAPPREGIPTLSGDMFVVPTTWRDTGAGSTSRRPPSACRRSTRATAAAATRVSPNAWAQEIVGFGRYELFDTQNKMPSGDLPLQEFQRSAWVVGTTYYPVPDVAFKFDVVHQRNKSSVVKAPWQINAGVGW